MLNLFLASSTSTSVTMCWFLVHISRHPHVLRKIRDEMRVQLPELGTCVPTMDELARLPYLEAAIKESLRLCVGVACCSANESTTLSDGTFVPLGCQMMIPLYATARMKSTWGSDAEEFNPERFIDEDTGGPKVLSPFTCLSFVGQCADRRFAMLEMKTLLASVLSRFDVHAIEDAVPVQSGFSLILPVNGDLMVHVRTASDSNSKGRDEEDVLAL
jgi:cytochrome P450